MATIKDVAQRAEVSVATVSNYLNQTKPVSRQVSLKIQQAVEELQYTQNLSARALKTNVYNDIGIILPNLNDSYYVQIFQGIESIFQNSNYYLNVAFTYDIPELEQNIVRNMMRKNVCGLILVSCQPEEWKAYYENFTRQNHPIVLIDRMIKSLDASFVSFDNRAALRSLTRQLLQMNYRKIYLMSGADIYTCEAECIEGYREAHAAEDIVPDEKALIQIDLNKEDAFRKTTALLHRGVPEVILTTSELSAAGILEALNVLGYSSSDIPVVTLGEDHWNKSTHSFASYSTARPAMKMGASAAKLLLEKLKSPLTQESEQLVLQGNVPEGAQRLTAVLGQTLWPQRQRAEGVCLRILMLDSPPVHTFCNLIKNFEKKTGIRVEVTLQAHHKLYQTIEGNHEADDDANQYDVYMYDMPWLPTLASRGILENISDSLQEINIKNFLPGCMQYFSEFEGKYYGLPFLYAPQILYYRKDLFDDPALRTSFQRLYGSALRPPLTFKEFNAVSEFFTLKTDAIKYGVSIPAAYDECLAPELYMRLRAYGSEIINREGRVVLDTPQALKAYINFVRAMRFAKPDYLSATDVSIVQDFLQGETAMLITYPAFLTNVSDLRKNSMIGSIGYSQIPGRSPLLGGWGFGINSRCAQKQHALDFIKWTCDAQMGNYFALLGGQTAIASTYTNDELVKLYPWLPLYQSAYQYTKPMLPPVVKRGRVVSPNLIDSVVCKWAYRLIHGELEMEQVLAGTQQELEQLLEQEAP